MRTADLVDQALEAKLKPLLFHLFLQVVNGELVFLAGRFEVMSNFQEPLPRFHFVEHLGWLSRLALFLGHFQVKSLILKQVMAVFCRCLEMLRARRSAWYSATFQPPERCDR